MLLMSWVCIELSIHAHLRSRLLEVLGARKKGAREGDIRGERELPLSLSVSLVCPIRRLQPRLLFFSPFNFFNVSPFICDQVFFVSSNSKVQSSFPATVFQEYTS